MIARSLVSGLALFALSLGFGSAQAETLRIITWGGYAPDEVIAQFEKDTGIDVEVTLSNNEEMISKLRATGGSGFDLAQPSQDRIQGPQVEFGIYKPLDLGKIDSGNFVPSMLAATKKNTTVDGKVYGVPHVWGTSGLVVNTKEAGWVTDYTDLCDPRLKGKVSYRTKRPTLIGFAYAMGMDPFATYGDPKAYEAMMEKVGQALIDCKPNVKFYWDGGKDNLLAGLRAGEIVAAMAWDTGGWALNNENPDVTFVAPESGALGWIDTFAIPARGANDEAAYKWINYVMQPEVSAKIIESAGNFTASKGADQLITGRLKEQFAESFPPEAVDNIKWYPPIPAGLEDIEGKILDRVKAAQTN